MAAATGSVTFMKKGRFYEEFTSGRVFNHHWGRTIHQSDNLLFCTMLMHFNPMYFNLEFARAHGHPSEVVNPYLAFNVVFGLSVEDLSEAGGFFLGMKDLVFKQPVYAGDTLTATSTVLEQRSPARSPVWNSDLAHRRLQSARGLCVVLSAQQFCSQTRERVMSYMTEERLLIQKMARDFTSNEVLSVANRLDQSKGDIPGDLRQKMAK